MTLYAGDLINHKFIYETLKKTKPDAIVHYAEQPSAPYSMIGRQEAVFTQYNNVIGTLNLMFGVKKYCPNSHILKLGTMGEYGQPNIDIEEGFLKITHKGRSDLFTYPKTKSYEINNKYLDNEIEYFDKDELYETIDLEDYNNK